MAECDKEEKRSRGRTENKHNHTQECKISNKRVFIDSQFGVGHEHDPFEKKKVEDQVIARLNKSSHPSTYMRYSYPDQGDSSLCGPAAFLYALLEDQPEMYKKYIKDLWDTGEATLGTLTIKPRKGTKNPTDYTWANGRTKVPAIDWISMASLRDSENKLFSYDSPDDQAAGITMWGKLSSWFKAVGATEVYHNMDITSSNLKNAVKLSSYVDSSHHVVTLIGTKMLSESGSSWKTHWIVWEGHPTVVSTGLPINITTGLDEIITLNLFSWGEKKQLLVYNLTLKQFLRTLYGGMVFSKIP